MTFLKHCVPAGLALTLFAASSTFHVQGDPAPVYQTGATTLEALATELHRALPREHRPLVSDPPVLLVSDPAPFVRAAEYAEGASARKVVFVSSGFIELANYLAHAHAVDKVQRGYLQKYTASLGQETGRRAVPPPADWQNAKFWTADVMNEQMSSFNQIVGAVVGIKLAHHYLGHYRKYAVHLNRAQSRTASITELLTPAEFEHAMATGIRNSLNCGLGIDGFKVLLECVEKMPQKPDWSAEFFHAGTKTAKLKRDLVKMEKNFFAGRL